MSTSCSGHHGIDFDGADPQGRATIKPGSSACCVQSDYCYSQYLCISGGNATSPENNASHLSRAPCKKRCYNSQYGMIRTCDELDRSYPRKCRKFLLCIPELSSNRNTAYFNARLWKSSIAHQTQGTVKCLKPTQLCFVKHQNNALS